MSTIHLPMGFFEQGGVLVMATMAVWATLVLGLAWGAASALQAASSAVRYCVWQFAVLSLLVVPILCAALPGIPLGFCPATWSSATENASQSNVSFNTPHAGNSFSFKKSTGQSGFSTPREFAPPPVLLPARSINDSAKSPIATATSVANAQPIQNFPGFHISWRMALVALWICGVALHLLWLMVSIARAQIVGRRAEIIPEAQFQAALSESQRRLLLRRRVRLLKSSQTKIPVVVGAFWPRILLPIDCHTWSAERLRMVLSHELAHVERRDVLWQLIARAVAACYWFHPLVWFAVRSMRQEREQACDDQVLLLGVASVDYAAGLVDVAAKLLGKNNSLASGIGMIQPSQLEGRVRAILSKSISRQPISVWGRRVILLATACIVLCLGLLRPFSPIRSRAAENPPLKNNSVTDTKPSLDSNTAASPDADALSNCFIEALKQKNISFLDDSIIAALRTELHDYLQDKIKLPLTPKRRAALTMGIQQYAERNLQDTEDVYLHFRDWLETLKWELWIAASQPELDDEQLSRRDKQREWMLDYINGLPQTFAFDVSGAPEKLRPNLVQENIKVNKLFHDGVLKRLGVAMNDPLNPFFGEVLSDEEFAAFQKRIAEKSTAISVQSMGDSNLLTALIDIRLPSLLKQWPTAKEANWSRANLEWRLSVLPSMGNATLAMEDVSSQQQDDTYVDVMHNRFLPHVPRDPAQREAWLEHYTDINGWKPDLCFDAKQDVFIGVRGAKLALLKADNWRAADQVPLTDLRKLIQEKGQSSVPVSEFGITNPQEHLPEKEPKPDAPCLVVQTKEGEICVIRVWEFEGKNPIIYPRQRPLAPNPPLWRGDVVIAEAAPESPADANAVKQTDRPVKPEAESENFKPAAQTEAEPTTSAPVKQPLFDDEGNQATKGSIKIHVVDSNGQPLAGVDIHTSVLTHEKDFKINQDYKTGADGQVNAELPPTLYLLRVWANKLGYVSGSHGWEKDPSSKRTPVPEEFTFHLQTGTAIGGKVVDEQGQPIADAMVTINSEPGGLLAYNDLKTDAEGRWKLDTAPHGDKIVIHVIASHPDFISLRSYFDMNLDDPVPIEQLRNQTTTTVLKRGLHVTGTVTDPDGKPVAKALAICGDKPYFEHKPQQEVYTDEQGLYHLPPLPAGSMRVTIVAQGWMPDMRQIEIKPDLPPQDFQLKPGKTLRIRVVDNDGAPVSKAGFLIDDWRGAQALYNNKHPNVIDSKIPRNTDEHGIYEWTWAPDDAVKFRISAKGDYCNPAVDFTADNQEHEFKLLPVLRVSGHVTDAKTGEPIEKFTIVPMEEFNENLLDTQRNQAKEFNGGQYELGKLDRTDVDYRLRVEAPGHRSAMSRLFHVGDKNPTADFQLEGAPDASGRVLDADGKPVQGAKVYLATKTQQLDNVGQDEDSAFSTNFATKTDAQGAFTFPAEFERYTVIAMNDSGYAEADLQPDQTPGDMKLQKWARVEGTLWQVGKPVADAAVNLYPLDDNSFRFGDRPYINDGLYAKTNADGQFVFERVPPVKCCVSAELSPWEKYPITSSQSVPLDLQPGQTVKLNLGGEGAQVTGRVKLAGEKAADFDLNWSLNYLIRKTPGIALPADLAAKDFDWQRGWNDSWTESLEGRAYRATLSHYFVRFSSDGTLLVSGVPAGEYELALRIYEHKNPKDCMVNPVGSKIIPFRVTDADVAKVRLDLGTITVDATLGPQMGDTMPDFEFQTLDGTKRKLGDLRGQYVVLDFWATWCNSCVAGLPQVRQLYDEYRTSGKVAVQSISLDSDQHAAREFIGQKRLSWPQAFLEAGPEANALGRLGISSIPTYTLISPDGKLVQNSHSLEEIKSKLAALVTH